MYIDNDKVMACEVVAFVNSNMACSRAQGIPNAEDIFVSPACAHIITQLLVEACCCVVCCHCKCSSKPVISSNMPSGRHSSSSSSLSLGLSASSSQKGHRTLACQSPGCGTVWFAIATGANTTLFSSWFECEKPKACHCGLPLVGEAGDVGHTASSCAVRTEGIRSRSSQMRCPSQKSQTNATSPSPNL